MAKLKYPGQIVPRMIANFDLSYEVMAKLESFIAKAKAFKGNMNAECNIRLPVVDIRFSDPATEDTDASCMSGRRSRSV